MSGRGLDRGYPSVVSSDIASFSDSGSIAKRGMEGVVCGLPAGSHAEALYISCLQGLWGESTELFTQQGLGVSGSKRCGSFVLCTFAAVMWPAMQRAAPNGINIRHRQGFVIRPHRLQMICHIERFVPILGWNMQSGTL